MTDERQVNDVLVYRDSAGFYRERPIDLTGSGQPSASNDDRDTDGNPVPTYKAHTYSYDASGNLATDTVMDGTSTWVRTFVTGPTGTTADSGWVKQ